MAFSVSSSHRALSLDFKGPIISTSSCWRTEVEFLGNGCTTDTSACDDFLRSCGDVAL
ncbi:hypothetical protein PC116_g14228 [Phytophthora cactorum]|nr:hypothetical protein PC116_g14228 [Phytophthora cactorum]